MTDHDGGGHPDPGSHPDVDSRPTPGSRHHPSSHPGGDGRSPGAATGKTTLGVSRVRPDRSRRRSPADGHHDGSRLRDEDRPRVDGRDPGGFEPRQSRDVPRDRWTAIALVCLVLVLVTLALVAETGVQIAAGLDVLALGPRDVPLLRRIDSALAATATHARYVAVAAGGFAVVVGAAATLVVAVRART